MAQTSPVWQAVANHEQLTHFSLPAIDQTVKQAWVTATQVSFCAKAFKAVAGEHPDVAPLTVLGGFLRNGYLHRAIREQGGAYGGGATFDGSSGAFRFYSYRDPRLLETLADFDESIDWLLGNEHSHDALEEAVLGVIGSMDKPGSPAGEAQSDFFLQLHRRSQAYREAFRVGVLSVTVDDLKRVAKLYLTKENESIAVVTASSNKQLLDDAGFDICTL